MVANGIEDGVRNVGCVVEQEDEIEEEEEEAEEEGLIPMEARKILISFASGWSDVKDSRAMEVVPIKGAMTNQVYQIKWPSQGPHPRMVLVRLYGEGVNVFFDRDEEIRTFECMSRHGQGPRLLDRFSNGRIEQFIHARTLSAVDLRDPQISALIALKLREFHDLDMPGPKSILLWNRMRKWLKVAKSCCPGAEAEEFCLDALEKEITTLENEITREEQRIGFCHNDLQYGNIMIDENTGVVTIIDYEYASYNPVPFDIANHFCEMAANYHTETPHILDFTKYPDFEERKRFVEIYLGSSGEKVEDAKVEKLLFSMDKYASASHIIWGLWGIISDHVNDIKFDYMEYARQRFRQFWSTKSATMDPNVNG